MQVRDMPLKDVKVVDRARIKMGDIDGLMASIEEKGLIQPITVDQNGRLLAGGRRYLAHERLKRLTIPCIIRQVDGIIDALEIELVENVQRKDLEWHERAKQEKRIYDYKTKVDPKWGLRAQEDLTGTSKSELSRRIQLAEAMTLIPELGEHKTQDDAWKEYKRLEEDVVRTHLHQKYMPHVKEAMDKAGEHFVIGDAFAGMAALPSSTYGFAEVDTPYGVDLDRRKSRNEDSRPMQDYNEWSSDEYIKLFGRAASEVYRLLSPNTFAVFWYGMSWHWPVLQTLRSVGFGVPDIPAVWIKGDAGQTASPNTTLGSCYEPFFLARKGSPVLAKPGRSNVFNFPKLSGMSKDHPTQKPLRLVMAIIETCLFPGSKIIVPFLGSGVTLRAAYRLGHVGNGWDMSQHYKNAFLKRIVEDQEKQEDGEDSD